MHERTMIKVELGKYEYLLPGEEGWSTDLITFHAGTKQNFHAGTKKKSREHVVHVVPTSSSRQTAFLSCAR